LQVLALAIAVSAVFLVTGDARRSALAATTAVAAPNGCEFPTTEAGSPAETAWRLFVAANCTAKGNQLVWETWTEQANVYPAGGAPAHPLARRLHGSPLALATMAKKAGFATGLPSSDCNPMKSPPPNVTKTTICEEVYLNPYARQFVIHGGYEFRPGQTKAAAAGSTITFPTPAIEVKVDWIPGTDFTPPFTCENPPKGVHVERIGGTCYAMAGMHIASKLAPHWIWATFEPQNLQTNPNRCITFIPCNDPWGSVPPTSIGGAGGFTQQSPALKALMRSAHLKPEFDNYRLDGVQTEFGTAANPTYLGNSIIEGENVGMTKNTASCITCHSVSTIQNTGTDGINTLALMPTPPVGPEYVPPQGWIARDFVWSLGLACPNGPTPPPNFIGSMQTCAPAPSTKAKAPKSKPTGS